MAAETSDSRRFFRLDIPIYCWAMPTSRIIGCELYATPVTYWTKQRKKRVEQAKAKALTAARALKENSDLMIDFYKDVFKRLDIFMEMFQLVEQGKSPLESSGFREAFKLLKQDNQLLTAYEKTAPKTHGYIKAIYDKMEFYCIEMIYLARHSSSKKLKINKLVSNTPTPADVYFDRLSQGQFANLDLPKFIVSLGELVNLYLEAFGLFQQDAINKNYPTRWPLLEANISEGGMKFNMPKDVRVGEQLCIAFYNHHSPSVFGLKGLVVGVNPLADSLEYQWRVNFDFPDRGQQMFIQSMMNQHELELFGALDVE